MTPKRTLSFIVSAKLAKELENNTLYLEMEDEEVVEYLLDRLNTDIQVGEAIDYLDKKEIPPCSS